MRKNKKMKAEGMALSLPMMLLTAVSITVMLLASGCGKAVETGSEPAGQEEELKQETVDAAKEANEANRGNGGNELAAALQAKYNAGTVDYSGDSISIDREEAVQIELGYNPWGDTAMILSESFVIYQDAELNYPIDAGVYDWDSESGMLTIEPPVFGPAEVVYMETDYPVNAFLEANDETGWGNLPQLYLAAYVDTRTGEPIQGNPLVTVLKIKEELKQAPQVKFSQDEYGSARLSWKEVPDADEYYIFRINCFEGTLDGYLNVLAVTTGTEWIAEQSMSMDNTYAVTANDMFRQYLFEDYQPDYSEYFGVMAVNSSGNSHISNLFNAYELAHMLPYAIAHSSNTETAGVSCQGTLNLPATMGITMCDETISQRVLEYDESSIEKSGDSYTIDYKISGTPFTDSFLVTEQNWDELDGELQTIKERQEKLMNKGGNIETDISFLDEEDIMQEEETTEMPVYENGKITANSALSEYLAIEMLSGREAIDVSVFPESADAMLVVDAFLEAQYQNPLILGIKEAGMDTANGILYLQYDDDSETMNTKRKELEEKVAEITAEIITDDMSDLEKELAINAYLCDNAVYDDGALESAAENDFQYVDEIFNDSFTAYGVLVNNVGVCASYSAAFKLLADAAGLESVVVTGYLEGSLPHAWNKVLIDGEWHIVDSTNNDNEVIQNALFNLSDSAAYAMLVEDDRFVLDGSLYDYEAPSDDKEYYHITDNYYEMDEIAGVLAEKLLTEGSAVLRTDYNLDDETFSIIAQDTANEAQGNISGLHWMGVIYLEQRQ